tara:strand:- start:344 stop:847 length:504 start_codon:yes stop_codon:yes gene_type:complete
VIKTVERNYLEIRSLDELNETNYTPKDYFVENINPSNFELNKFFYKNIGKKHYWKDRLSWSDRNWIEYTENKNLDTYILKFKKDLVGYFELLHHEEKNEIEIAYLGLLEEYQNQKLGSFLLTSAIKEAFLKKTNRIWVHTCSLDHKNALNNYLSRGMKIFKTETISI